MTLLCKCGSCGKPITVKLADSTTEAGADWLARMLRCDDCAKQAVQRFIIERICRKGGHHA